MQRATRIVTGLAVIALMVGGSEALAQSTRDVMVADNEFQPASIEVTAGDTVRWTQTGSNPHTVTADDGSFDSHPNCPPDCMSQGDTFERTFNQPGEVPYYCKIHGGPGGQGMAGVIVVQAAAEEDDAQGDAGEEGTSQEENGEADTAATDDAEATDDRDEGLPETGAPVALGLLGFLSIGLAALGAVAVLNARRLQKRG